MFGMGLVAGALNVMENKQQSPQLVMMIHFFKDRTEDRFFQGGTRVHLGNFVELTDKEKQEIYYAAKMKYGAIRRRTKKRGG